VGHSPLKLHLLSYTSKMLEAYDKLNSTR
jgi:hypothetical protein